MGRRAGQGARQAHCTGTGDQGGTEAGPRQLDEYADPPLSEDENKLEMPFVGRSRAPLAVSVLYPASGADRYGSVFDLAFFFRSPGRASLNLSSTSWSFSRAAVASAARPAVGNGFFSCR